MSDSNIVCPIQCVKSGCDSKDFLEKHSAFVVTVVGISASALTMLFTYFLKSRCKKVSFGCLSCERDVVSDVELQNVKLDNKVPEETPQ